MAGTLVCIWICLIVSLICLIMGLPMTMVGCSDDFWCPLYKKRVGTIFGFDLQRYTCQRCLRSSGSGGRSSCREYQPYTCFSLFAKMSYDGGNCTEMLVKQTEISPDNNYGYVIGRTIDIYVSTIHGTCGLEKQAEPLAKAGFTCCVVSIVFFVFFLTLALGRRYKCKAPAFTPVGCIKVMIMKMRGDV